RRKRMHRRRDRSYKRLIACHSVAILLLIGAKAKAEDGHRLWLRYDPLPKQTVDNYRTLVTSIVVPGESATLEALRRELAGGCARLLGREVPVAQEIDRDGAVVVGTPQSSSLVASLKWERQLAALGREGFCIRSLKLGRYSATVIASSGEVGALYGAFHF